MSVSRTRRAFRLVLLAALVVLVAWVVVLDRRVVARFAAGPDRIHTRFFSDRFRLERGMDTERVGLQERLRRLRYREDPALSEAGTWRRIVARIKRLDAMAGRLRQVEKHVGLGTANEDSSEEPK